MPRKPRPTGLPSRTEILDFIASSDQPAGKREIARAFGLKGQDKVQLKALLRDMAGEGLIGSAPGRAFHKAGGVPKVTVLRVVEADDSGNIWAVPEHWEAETPAPKLRVIERGKRSALGLGDRILSRTEERGQGFVAHPMKKLARTAELVLGVIRKDGDRFWLTPVEKKERRELAVSDLKDASAGDLVLCEVSGRGPRVSARVDAVLGDPFAPKSFSLIAIHKYELPNEFSDAVTEEAKRVAKQPLDEREDLTNLPIVAIDPADARDHDDAIWAAPDDDPDNKGGWKAIVAIADVSFYVRPRSALDKSARSRGNSVYFPDQVVPMLPEELSADICSLKAGEDRAAMACHLKIARDGTLKSWRFARAKICVAANIAYENAQAAMDAAGEERIEIASPTCSMPEIDDQVPSELVESALKPLWSCWRALLKARDKREPLELDLPERQVVLDEKGRIQSVAPRERLDAHRLVEDYMIAANVAAARALEARQAPVMYRVHEPPSREKLVALKDYLDTFEIQFTLGQVIKPGTFNRIIERVGDADFRPEIMEQLLRTQMQARYGPERHGHFGLSLATYAHFTSPIRRYGDLLVHRALVRAYKLGEGGLPPEDAEKFEEIGEQISRLERRAMQAERETLDRFVAAFLADQVGQLVDCRITGVQPFGFFATVTELGGDGLVPAATLGSEYFRYDEKSQQLVGEQSGETYRQGRKLKLRIVEANPVSGGLRFELPEGSYGGARQANRRDRTRGAQRRGRPANIPHSNRRRRRGHRNHCVAASLKRQGDANMAYKIAILVGSLRDASINRKVAKSICAIRGDHLDCSMIEIGNLPLYNQEYDGDPPQDYVHFRDQIRESDGVLFVSPEYNRGVPGVLKNAIDVGSRPYGKSVWNGKPAAIITVSPGSIGGFGANHQIRQACVYLNMPVMQQPEAYLGNVSDDSFDKDGCLKDGPLKELIEKLANAFHDWVDVIHRSRAALAGTPEQRAKEREKRQKEKA